MTSQTTPLPPTGTAELRAWVEVDLAAVRRNAETLARRAGVPLLPMIKADAYGLGAVPVARTLAELAATWGFGVATVEEGSQLREAGIAQPILIFTTLIGQDLARAAQHAFIPVLGRGEQIERWASTGLPWHLGIDTGMARAGVRWDAIGHLAPLLRRMRPPDGACTHFHSAELNDGSMEIQETRFIEALGALPARPELLHAENGAAIVRRPRSRWSLVRPGIFLYGIGSGAGAQLEPEPVVSLRGRIVDLRTVQRGESVSYDATWRARDTRTIATIPVGYADGYRRSLSNVGVALLNGRRVPVAGVVTMDMTMLDVTGVPCGIGDVATLLGADGGERVDVEEVARLGAVSPYELLTGLRQRLPRIYA